MEDAYIVKGGKTLKGSVVLSGAKNLALKTIIASLMFKTPVVLENVPHINDVNELLHLIKKLGATVTQKEHTVTVDPSTLTSNKPDLLHASQLRASFLLFAPLLHVFKECAIPNPGGCRIGQRPIDRIVSGMKSLGVSVSYDSDDGYYHARLSTTPHGEYRFSKPTHTGSELLIMLASLGDQKVVIDNVALEPEIDELINFLNQAGAEIIRDNARVTIRGVSELRQSQPFRIFGDRNEAVTFAILAVATKGSIEIHDLKKEHVLNFNEKMREAGVSVVENENSITYSYKGSINPVSITTEPHPGFMTDWQPNWAVFMTQASGTATIHETVFENRFSYVEELRKLGAKIDFVNTEGEEKNTVYHFNSDSNEIKNQKISITGCQPLHPGVMKIADLRAGATLLIAALIVSGETVVTNASILERGYENIVEKITQLGGVLKRV